MTRNRIFVLLWLIVSQLGGGILVLVPLMGAGIFGMLMMGGGGIQLFFIFIASICGVIFILLAITIGSWVAFFRKKDKTAAILSGICLLIESVLYTATQIWMSQAS